MATKDWDSLPTEKKRVLLDEMSPTDLARQYGKPKELFQQAKAFFASLPKQTAEPEKAIHNPPKDLIVSARRDLSFYEANFELIDNSIDEWRRRGAKKTLEIHIDYDLDLLTGIFKDNAGGMDQGDVFRVFIPGETSNKDVKKNVIGSFGMGAKKGIFRLTDGARVVSSPDGKVSYTSEVPENWELEKSWETRDGLAEAIKIGETHLYFFKLVAPPTQADIEELRRRAGTIYGPLLTGELGKLAGEPKARLQITIGGTKVTPAPDIVWASPEGAEPRTYEMEHRFQNTMGGKDQIYLRFILRCGILTKQPAGGPDSGFGVDVYGNGRLIQRHLQDEFGFGTTGLSKRTPSTQFVRAKLYIIGHSGGIPWDTHKREYLADHPVSEWLRQQVRQFIKAYADVAKNFTDKGTIEARSQLTETVFDPEQAMPPIKVSSGKTATKSELPKLTSPVKQDEPKPQTKTKTAPTETADDIEDDQQGRTAEISDAEPESISLTLEFSSSEFGDLCSRFQADSADSLQEAIRDCLIGGVAFTLEGNQLQTALKKFKCEEGVADLSERIKEQLIKKL